MNNQQQNKICCSNVHVRTSTLSKEDTIFDGAFANKDFKKNELIEYGIVRLLPECFEGNDSPFVFTWSNDIPNTKWAMTSGCAMFYNTSLKEPNVRMDRNFDDNTFKIVALRDIQQNEELFHTYKSLKWRKCFQDIRDKICQ